MYNEILKNRIEAGKLLSEKLKKYQDSNTIILAVPRGGVPIGCIIAQNLHLPLDIILSKKIGHPYNKEFAIGAVSVDSMIIDNRQIVPKDYIEEEIGRLREGMQEKYQLYMGDQKPLDIKDKNIILVDDGIATGNTLLASITMLQKKNPAKIIVAVPVLPADAIPSFEQSIDELVYLMAPQNFNAVGEFYEQFFQVEDDEVIQLLHEAKPKK